MRRICTNIQYIERENRGKVPVTGEFEGNGPFVCQLSLLSHVLLCSPARAAMGECNDELTCRVQSSTA